jgi:tRNA-binding protein
MEMNMTIQYSDFEQVDLRSGTVVRAEPFPKAIKPSYKIWVDFGEKIGVKQSSAQVTVHYTPESLIGRQVVGCVNLGARNIAGFMSEFLLVGFPDQAGAVCLITVDPKVPNGQKLF